MISVYTDQQIEYAGINRYHDKRLYGKLRILTPLCKISDELTIPQVIVFKKIAYAVNQINRKEQMAIVSKCRFQTPFFDKDEVEEQWQDAFVCPYCGYEDWEKYLGVSEGEEYEEECPHCGSKVTFCTETEVKVTTTPKTMADVLRIEEVDNAE